MRSARPLPPQALSPPSFDDLTARARIREMALRQFAERGIERSTLRSIAADAGVSLGLVQHHFGSKEGLRAACDQYVMGLIRREARQAVDERLLGDPDFITAAYQSGPLVMRYLARALVDGSPAAAALFDEIVDLTETYLARTGVPPESPAGSTSDPPASVAPAAPGASSVAPDDARAQAAVFTAMKLGISVFHEHLSRVLGVDALSQAGYPRIARATLALVSPHVLDPDLAALAEAGLGRLAPATAPETAPAIARTAAPATAPATTSTTARSQVRRRRGVTVTKEKHDDE